MIPRHEKTAGERKQAAADVRKIYAELASRPVERDCALRAGCCQFLLTGKTPHLTKGEALVAAQALKATGRRALPTRRDGACPLLDPATAKCLIYDSRPFGCRTHFCAAAGGPYPRRDVADLIHKLEDIARRLGGSEARPLAPAIEGLLAQDRQPSRVIGSRTQ
ncbi:MAG: YkgJ family cysteine cluster protein [Terrimicrobiaceae bacterium]